MALNMVKLASNMVNMVELVLDDILLHLIVYVVSSFGGTYLKDKRDPLLFLF